MAADPSLEHRQPIPYVAIRGAGSGEGELRAFADASFPALFGWLNEHGATPVGAPFFRYFRFVRDGEFEVEVGVPISTPIEITSDHSVRVAELPAGRYVTYVHEGAYSADDGEWAGRDLRAAHVLLDAWAAEREIAWAIDADGSLSVSTEQYLVGPVDTDDPEQWRTEITKLVAS